MPLRYVACFVFLLVAGCASTTITEWTQQSKMAPLTAFNVLSSEMKRCFPDSMVRAHKLEEIGEYQVKVYDQPGSTLNYEVVNARTIYSLKIKKVGEGSEWKVISTQDKTSLEDFERSRRLCR